MKHEGYANWIVLFPMVLLSATVFAQIPLTDGTQVTPPIANNVGLSTTNYRGSPYPDVERLLVRAQSGQVDDEMKLARAFELGLGVPQDAAEAAKWMLKAANQGNPVAQTDIGYSYFTGTGVPEDQKQAFTWFQRAALSNYAPAQVDLGLLLIKGLGVRQDRASGAKWLTRAARQGFAPAELHVGILYAFGIGVERDQPEAVRWVRKSAKHEYVPAELVLGQFYELGMGLVVDLTQAAHYYRKAAEAGSAVAQNIASEDAVRVEAEAEDWVRKHQEAISENIRPRLSIRKDSIILESQLPNLQ